MFSVLRIIFCILACIGVTAGFFIGAYLGFEYALISFGAAALFAILMFAVKEPHREKEKKPDFMFSEEENAHIRDENNSAEEHREK